MGCNSCKQKVKNNLKVLNNMREAFVKQDNKVAWFKDGVSGLLKCIGEKTSYTDEEITRNRDICANCPHATKNEKGKLTSQSQCMAPDSETGAPCGCFILCKTQVDKCPLEKWG